jgi:hypothetical protein
MGVANVVPIEKEAEWAPGRSGQFLRQENISKTIISVGNRHHAYVSNHMKTKTDQHATHNTLKSVPTLPR